jgi:uncharacterized membrane protein HdeD (DUF308 family)
MLATPARLPKLEYDFAHSAAEEVSRRWWVPLLNGLLLIVAGVLIFSIDWGVRSLATFIGALFIVEGVAEAMSGGIDQSTRRTNVLIGLLSIAAGVAIIAWPSPGLVAVAVFLGSWLIVMGTATIAGSFAARRILPNWWLWLILGLLKVPLGVLALADPGATLAALVTVAGIWAVAIGVTEVILAFEVRHLPRQVDEAFGVAGNGRRSIADSSTPKKTPTRVPNAQASN